MTVVTQGRREMPPFGRSLRIKVTGPIIATNCPADRQVTSQTTPQRRHGAILVLNHWDGDVSDHIGRVLCDVLWFSYVMYTRCIEYVVLVYICMSHVVLLCVFDRLWISKKIPPPPQKNKNNKHPPPQKKSKPETEGGVNVLWMSFYSNIRLA